MSIPVAVAHRISRRQRALALRLPGCFAMTEIGHGSNVAGILTTATYDEGTEEFVIHTPVRAAWKDYLGNAALHGRAAVVFAQLYTKGEGHGVHAFFVPIREDDGEGGGGDRDVEAVQAGVEPHVREGDEPQGGAQAGEQGELRDV